jgi:hypothetical protein
MGAATLGDSSRHRRPPIPGSDCSSPSNSPAAWALDGTRERLIAKVRTTHGELWFLPFDRASILDHLDWNWFGWETDPNHRNAPDGMVRATAPRYVRCKLERSTQTAATRGGADLASRGQLAIRSSVHVAIVPAKPFASSFLADRPVAQLEECGGQRLSESRPGFTRLQSWARTGESSSAHAMREWRVMCTAECERGEPARAT